MNFKYKFDYSEGYFEHRSPNTQIFRRYTTYKDGAGICPGNTNPIHFTERLIVGRRMIARETIYRCMFKTNVLSVECRY